MDKKESRVLATFNNIWLYWQKSNLLSANFFQIVVSKDFFLSGKHLSLITLQDRVNTCYVHIRKCFKSQKMYFSNNFTRKGPHQILLLRQTNQLIILSMYLLLRASAGQYFHAMPLNSTLQRNSAILEKFLAHLILYAENVSSRFLT